MKQIAFLFAVILSGCGIIPDGNPITSSEYTYEFDENGCKTNRHSFTFRNEYCSALENHSLNNYCAFNLRREEYRKKCGSPLF